MRRILEFFGVAVAAMVLAGSTLGSHSVDDQLARMHWPEKEGVTHAYLSRAEMEKDSCVRPDPTEGPIMRSTLC